MTTMYVPTEYTGTWSNRRLTAEANSPDDMVRVLKQAIADIEVMKDAGVEFDFSQAARDYIYVRTTDLMVARKCGFAPEGAVTDEEVGRTKAIRKEFFEKLDRAQ